jgi:predicted DNA-binding transcriptional regulator AlpA
MNTHATTTPTTKRKRAHVALPPDFADPATQDVMEDVDLFAFVTGTGTSSIWRFVAEGRIKPPTKFGRLSKWPRRYVRQVAAEGIPAAA